MRLGTACIALAIVAGSPAFAQGGRYELVPEPDVRQTSTNRVTSAYVIDKKANQFWICTARYNFQDLTANNGDCVKLPSDIGRPSLTEAYDMRVVTGSAAISVFLGRYRSLRLVASLVAGNQNAWPYRAIDAAGLRKAL